MPVCVECGVEAPREEMFGLKEELRCQKCVQRHRDVYRPLRQHSRTLPPAVVVGICVVSIALYLIPQLHDWLVDQPIDIWKGEIWRFATTVFLHASPMHLVFNLLAFWYFGRDVESWMGHFFFLGFVLLTGVGSMAAEFLLSVGPAVGLSGVVYALFGLLFALKRRKDFAIALLAPNVVWIMFIWLGLCLLMPGVANAAHFGGFGLGWLLGRATQLRKAWIPIAGLVLVVAAMVGASTYMPWNDTYRAWRQTQRIIDLFNNHPAIKKPPID
ncbi:rhomboid family protein [Planctomycetes bacterium Pan216]